MEGTGKPRVKAIGPILTVYFKFIEKQRNLIKELKIEKLKINREAVQTLRILIRVLEKCKKKR